MAQKKEVKLSKNFLVKSRYTTKILPKVSFLKHSSSQVSNPLLVGTITHYYSDIGVGVVEVKKPLQVGDALQITGRGKTFAQKAKSMQLEHIPISLAKKGHIIGLKVSQPVKPNDAVYKFR